MKVIKIKLSFSNAYLVQDQRTILVDTGMPGEEGKILNAAKKAGIEPGDISLILHTHGHVDHAGSSAALNKILKIPTAIHKADAEMTRKGQMNPLHPLRLEARLILPVVSKPFPPFQPDILMDKETSLDDFGVNGYVIHTPGHTAGSLSVILPTGEAMVGDVMMGGYMGGNILAARPNYHYFADDLDAIHASIQKILALETKTLYVGHGGPLDSQAARQRWPMA